MSKSRSSDSSNQSGSRRRRRRKRKFTEKVQNFSSGVGLSPARIAGSLLLLGLIGFFIFSIATTGEEEKSDEPVTISEDKALKLELSTDQILQQLSDAKVNPNQNFVVIIDQMAAHERELEKIESSIEPTEAQKVAIEKIRLRNKSVTVSLMMNNKVACDREKVDLLNFCLARVDTENPEIRESCRFWLCSLPAIGFALDPSAATLQSLSSALRKYPDGYLESPEKAATLAALMFRVGKQSDENTEYIKKVYVELADQFDKSDLQDIKDIASTLRELSIFGEFDLPTLENRILWGDPSATDDLAGAFDAISEHPTSNPETWLTVIRAYERYLAVGKIEQAGKSWQKMWAYSEQLKNEKSKKAIQDILNRQKTRALFLDKTIDVSGYLLPDNEPIEANHQKYYAIIFCDKQPNSLRALVKLGEVANTERLKYLPVLVFENELSDNDMKTLHMVPKEIRIANFETSQKYYSMFPADFFPYVLVVDKEGKVISVNVDMEQIDSRVARVEAQKRRKRMEAVGGESQPAATVDAP